jgi:transcriptional regulator with XRE-family HTH domain
MKSSFPYKSLGNHLRRMREKLQESVADVSGAVEIDTSALAAFEQGVERPSEDILLLLISHFGVKEDEAGQLWKLAGYDKDDLLVDDTFDPERPPVFVMPGDARIAYTDMVHVMVNNYGVVLNFMQGAGPNNQPMIVSRVGMSREHAESLLELLQRTLYHNEPKALPHTKNKPNSSKSKRRPPASEQ